MAKKRNSFAKIGILCVVMLVALGVLGATFTVWADTLYIDSTVSIGTVGGGLVGDSGSPGISCPASGDVLAVTVTTAQPDIEYTCQFTVQNTGTIPVKIQSISIDDVPLLVSVWVTGIEEGDQIEDGEFMVGTVHVFVDLESPFVGQTFTSTVTITVVQWNLYVYVP